RSMKLARILAAASSGTNSQSTSPAETSYTFSSGWSTTTPRSDSVSAMARTSSISGTLLNRQRSPVRVAAASILRAAFLAPLTRIVPSSATPPSTRKRSRGSFGGSNSQWNGLASAIGTGLPPPATSLVLPALRHADAQQGLLQRRARDGEVRALLVAGLERLLGLAPGLLGLLEIDLGRHVRGLGHHHDLVRPDLHEAADDGERFLVAAAADAQLADAQRRQERRVVGQHAQLAVRAGQHDRSTVSLNASRSGVTISSRRGTLGAQLGRVGLDVVEGAGEEER